MKTQQGSSLVKKFKFGLYSPRLGRFISIREYRSEKWQLVEKGLFFGFRFIKNKVYYKKITN